MVRVLHIHYYDNLFAEIEVARLESSAEEAAAQCQETIIILQEDRLCLVLGDQTKYIKDSDRTLYSFEIVTKVTPSPIDPRTLSDNEKIDLLNNPDFMLSDEDFQKVPWSISEAYRNLKRLNPDKKEFFLSSSSYRIEEVETN